MQKQLGCFDRWRRFLEDNGIKDEWLAGFTPDQRTRLLSAFAAAVRRNMFGTREKGKLRGSTVKATVTNVRSTFRSNFRTDPGLDGDGKISLFLTRQLSGYVDVDSSNKQEKALPLSVFRKMLENKFTPVDEAMGQLAVGAFFFGMRSCEYLTVRGTRKTRQLTVRNIRFFKNNTELKVKTSNFILYADTVSITFTFQKNRKKMITVTQPRSGKPICPVIVWAKIILRILSYEGSTEDTNVNAVQLGKKLSYITREKMLTHIRHTVDNMSGLGFKGDEVGTHSIRSSLAMALYLSRRPVSTIMLLGRWSSDAFLLYIRRQVQEFSTGVSGDMVSNEKFFTIPDLDESDALDPRTRNPQSFANTVSLNGPNAATEYARRPAMHVWH